LNEFEKILIRWSSIFKIIKKSDHSLLIEIKVQAKPNSKKVNCQVNQSADCLIISVDAPPVDGKANKRIVEILSDYLGVSKKNIEIEKGDKSKIKKVLTLFEAKNEKDLENYRLKLTSILKD